MLPTTRLQVALVGVSSLAAASLLWGSVLLQAPPRSHLAALIAVVGVTATVLVRLRDRNTVVRWTAGVLALVVFLGAILLGGYDHLLKVVLAGHGLPAATLAQIIPPLFGPTGDWAYETLGIALLPLALYGLTTLKALVPQKDEE